MNKNYGKTITITGDIVYVGDGKDFKDNLDFQLWKKALENCSDRLAIEEPTNGMKVSVE